MLSLKCPGEDLGQYAEHVSRRLRLMPEDDQEQSVWIAAHLLESKHRISTLVPIEAVYRIPAVLTNYLGKHPSWGLTSDLKADRSKFKVIKGRVGSQLTHYRNVIKSAYLIWIRNALLTITNISRFTVTHHLSDIRRTSFTNGGILQVDRRKAPGDFRITPSEVTRGFVNGAILRSECVVSWYISDHHGVHMGSLWQPAAHTSATCASWRVFNQLTIYTTEKRRYGDLMKYQMENSGGMGMGHGDGIIKAW
ncbi:hypothetical protein B0H14DRAFT_3123590 [Mycena olivaceomarginata]|nr:hypothetical protein B0H14DRAFT_3123590 [Mycena olivaceomarginata]